MPLFDFIEDKDVREKAESAHTDSMSKVKTDMEASIDSKINDAVSGLKSKNEELLNEKKTIQETLKNFDNIDPDKARDALKFLEDNEEAQLLKDGKFDELFAKKTSNLLSDFEAKELELSTKLTSAETEGSLYRNRYESKMVEDSLREAAVAAKVRPEALTDIVLRGNSVFNLGTDSTVEARDKDGKFVKIDDKVLTPGLWIESLKKTSPHYWPASEGVNANPGNLAPDDLTAALNKAAADGNMDEYRRLREKKKA